MKTRWIGLLIVLLLIAAAAIYAGTTGTHYTEDFSTKEFCDTLNTTAWWDTTTGELKLYPFVSSIVGSYDTPDLAQSICIAGDYIFVADYTTGLLVLDISDPATPTLAGSYNTAGNAKEVYVWGEYAYVADDSDGLKVIDISDPTTPTLAGSYNTPGSAWGIFVDGDYAFVTDFSYGLQVIDISDPTTPTLTATYNTAGNAYGVHVSGDYAFVADYVDGLKVIDISDPTTPTLAGSYNTSGYSRRVWVAGDYAYIADAGSGLQIFDISDPTTPLLAGSYNTPGSALDVYVASNRAFVADGASGLLIIDITDRSAPTLAETWDTPGAAQGVIAAGRHVFVGDGTSGLRVIRHRGLADPLLEGVVNNAGGVFSVEVSGDLAFIAGSVFFKVADISDPAAPSIVGSYGTAVSMDVDVSGDHAYIAEWNNGLYVFDVSNPASLNLVGSYDTPCRTLSVAVSGDYVYLGDQSIGWFRVIDVSDPTTPVEVGDYELYDGAEDICIRGDHAYVANAFDGLQVIDISDPTTPAQIGHYDTADYCYGIDVAGDYAYIANYREGLQVFDISDPTTPTLAGSYNTPDYGWDVSVSGDYAFLANGYQGVLVFDISDPTTPTLAASQATSAEARAICVDGDHAFLGIYANELLVHNLYSVFDVDLNGARSLAIDNSSETIYSARLTSTQTDSVAWEVSANGGGNWRSIVPDGTWLQFFFPGTGTDLVWRSTHVRASLDVNPAVTQLDIEWLTGVSIIYSIDDIPDDQGGWIRVNFSRSGLDHTSESSLPIEDYGIWRRIDSVVMKTEVTKVSAEKPGMGASTDAFGVIPIVSINDRQFVRSGPETAAAADFPPGTWEWVGSVQALQQDTYIAAIPSVADSSASGTNHTILVVTAHTTTPSVWYISTPDSGYSQDNIPPAVPSSFVVAYNTGSGNSLSWDPCPDDDFQYFRVYRSSDPGFTPSPVTEVHSTTSTGWSDPEYDGWPVYYKVTALDQADNESDPASAGTATGVIGSAVPQVYALHQNVPNPFNPSTMIRYDVPQGGGVVSLRIYDVSGRLVRTLVEGTESAGQKSAAWDGADNNGARVSSGIYLYRLETPEGAFTHKMLLLK